MAKYYKRVSRSTQSTVLEVIKLCGTKMVTIKAITAKNLGHVDLRKNIDTNTPKNWAFVLDRLATPATKKEFTELNRNFHLV